MAGLVQSIMRSTIGARLILLMLVPLAGLVLFGILAAKDERHAVVSARVLRREAHLLEVLAAATTAIDIDIDSTEGIRQASQFGVDVERLASLFGDGSSDASGAEGSGAATVGAGRWVEVLAAEDATAWADPDAVAQLQVAWQAFAELRANSDADDKRLGAVYDDLSAAASEALEAQVSRLNQSMGLAELGPELTAMGLSIEHTLQLSEAAREERRALSAYLLPIADESTDQSYRRLVATHATLADALEEVEHSLPQAYVEQLDAIRATRSWERYSDLRDQALAGDAGPPGDFDHPLELVPTGITSFVHGFGRTHLLLDLNLGLSRDFATGAAELESQANQRLASDLLILGLLATITCGLSVVVVRSITWPLRDLLERARSITGGDLTTHGPAGGPADFATVHAAFDEMSTNLRTVADQAEALSAGRLDDQVLNQAVAGPLGTSVHGSVARLRSMTARLEYEASHDALTRLPNRSVVISLLDRCLTGREDTRTPLAVVMLDLDGFKLANDNMGHSVGDEVLVQVAQRIQRAADGELVARLGGDEFMIVASGDDCSARAHRLGRAAVEAISSPTRVSSGVIQISASAGLVSTAGPPWLSPTEVLRRVDLALYEAKADGPGALVEFDQRLHDSLLATTKLQGELRQALGRDEFDLHLQPILTIGDGAVSGYEALIRWTSPSRGQISPGLFIPVAEQSDLITHIDTWVIGRAAELLGQWRSVPAAQSVSLSVNISARHLSHPDLPARIESALAHHGVPPDRLVIEVTESQLIPNLARAEDGLRRLRHAGVKLAIDDFGTGYASVAHLRRVAFDRIKIDQGFLANLDDDTERSLAGLLVSLGRDLDLEVVAEGIETEAQYEWAVAAGCTHAQGYLLGRPGPAPDRPGSPLKGRSAPRR